MKHGVAILFALLLLPISALHAACCPGACFINRLQIQEVVVDEMEAVLDHQAGTIEVLELRDLSVPAATKLVQRGGGARITEVHGASLN
jgi:hypothetical protein